MKSRTPNPKAGDGSEQRSRLCYVIMPFSATDARSEEEWTDIFENLIKPAVEGAELGYECRRSEATRGNIIKAIIESLHEAWVVIADLTDQKPNVFYELGVRHALANRTILLTQDLTFIPFDLRPYATYVYNWETTADREAFALRIKELLADVDNEPDRLDNPVSDFLGSSGRVQPDRAPSRTTAASSRREPHPPQTLAGLGSEAVDASELGRQVGESQNLAAL